MGKFANVCEALHNLCLHYKVRISEFQDLPSAATASYFDDGIDFSLEISQLRQISEHI